MDVTRLTRGQVGDPLYDVGGLPKAAKYASVELASKKRSPSTPIGHLVDDNTISIQPDNNRVALPTDCGYHLHAWKIEFDHPSRPGERIRIVAEPVPEALQLPVARRPTST